MLASVSNAGDDGAISNPHFGPNFIMRHGGSVNLGFTDYWTPSATLNTPKIFPMAITAMHNYCNPAAGSQMIPCITWPAHMPPSGTRPCGLPSLAVLCSWGACCSEPRPWRRVAFHPWPFFVYWETCCSEPSSLLVLSLRSSSLVAFHPWPFSFRGVLAILSLTLVQRMGQQALQSHLHADPVCRNRKAPSRILILLLK